MLPPIPAPMLAKAATRVPEADSIDGGIAYEPKWDGFRALVRWDGTTLEIGSRGGKPLTRYFPELVGALQATLPAPCLIDGEIAVPIGPSGERRLDWDALTARIHPAASRVAMLAEQTPAIFIAFDLLGRDERDLMPTPFGERRAELITFLRDLPSPVHVTRSTEDAMRARRWLDEFEGAGLDGVVAKPLAHPYAPGKRTLIKVKHSRTAEVVAIGYRIHRSGEGVGALLLGLHTAEGELVNVGAVAAWSDAHRRALVDELAPLVARDEHGAPISAETERSRFSAGADLSFVPLRPDRVLEVRYDQLEKRRFRHTVQFARWRPDRDAASCTFEQLDAVHAYDLDAVLET